MQHPRQPTIVRSKRKLSIAFEEPSVPCWRTCFCTTRSTCGWRGPLRTFRSSDTRTISSVTVRAPRRRGSYGARLLIALRPASWCCIRRRRRSSTVRMRTGVAISRTNRSIFSVSHTEQGRRYGRDTSTRTVSCPQLDRKRSRPSAGRSGVGHFTITVTSPCKIWPKRTIRISKAGSTTTGTSIGRSCARPSRGSMPMSSAGRAGSSSGCVTKPKERETGLSGFAVPIQVYSLIGSYVMATAEHREPYESRGSRTCLGARGGEIPPRDSTKPECLPNARMSASTSCGHPSHRLWPVSCH